MSQAAIAPPHGDHSAPDARDFHRTIRQLTMLFSRRYRNAAMADPAAMIDQ